MNIRSKVINFSQIFMTFETISKHWQRLAFLLKKNALENFCNNIKFDTASVKRFEKMFPRNSFVNINVIFSSILFAVWGKF